MIALVSLLFASCTREFECADTQIQTAFTAYLTQTLTVLS